MKDQHCCNVNSVIDEAKARRILNLAGLSVPGTLLVLLPKCPLCLAAYMAAVTGVGLSVSTAANIRMLILILCIGSLLYFAVKRLCRFTSQLRTQWR